MKLELNTQKIKDEVERRENLFRKKTKAQKRVLIAKDIIEQIKTKKIEVSQGQFVESNALLPFGL